MKVKEAYDRVDHLKRLSNNVRLMHQYFLNRKDLCKEIEESTGMDSTLYNTMICALDELSTLASKYEKALLEAEIVELQIK